MILNNNKMTLHPEIRLSVGLAGSPIINSFDNNIVPQSQISLCSLQCVHASGFNITTLLQLTEKLYVSDYKSSVLR